MLAPAITRRDCAGLLATCAAFHVLACERPRVEKPPPGPRVEQPADVIPPDLDLTVRIAVSRLRESLGAQALGELESRVAVDALSDPLATRALSEAEVAWIALRLGLPDEQTDNVLVLSGDFQKFEVDSKRWSIPTDLGAGWQYHDVKVPVSRAQPSRLYSFVHEIRGFASEADIDAVDRLLSGGVRAERVTVPERGLVSLAASMPALAEALRASSPKAAAVLSSGEVVTAYADLGAQGVEAFFSFEFGDERRAERAAAAAELLRIALDSDDGVTGMVARSARVNTAGGTVSLEIALSQDQLVRWVTCRGEADCGGSDE